MRDDADVNTGLKTLNELEALKLCILEYFKGKSASPPVKKDESLILSAVNRYFNGGPEH